VLLQVLLLVIQLLLWLPLLRMVVVVVPAVEIRVPVSGMVDLLMLLWHERIVLLRGWCSGVQWWRRLVMWDSIAILHWPWASSILHWPWVSSSLMVMVLVVQALLSGTKYLCHG